MTIFDYINNVELASYWNELTQDRDPYPLEALWPNMQKRGLDLKWIKGSKGLPIALQTSAFDAHAIPRPRIGFESMSTQMPYFKESKYIDEEMRQELNIVLATGHQAYIDAIVNRIFDDQLELLEGAASTREMMRSMLITSGTISLAGANGQAFDYDYGIPANHKGDAAVAWTDYENADPIEDMRVAKQLIEDETGAVIANAICSGKTWRDLRSCKKVREGIFILSGLTGIVAGAPNDEAMRSYFLQEVGINIQYTDKRHAYKAANGDVVQTKYIPDDTISMFPEGQLGNTWFGTTPAESDLLGSAIANVSIVDTGVSITSVQKADPVQTETIVAMICLPDFPQADKVYIMDTNP